MFEFNYIIGETSINLMDRYRNIITPICGILVSCMQIKCEHIQF